MMNKQKPKTNLSSRVGLPVWWENDMLYVDERFLAVYKVISRYVEHLKLYYLNPVTVFPKIVYKAFWLKEQDNKLPLEKIGIRIKLVALYNNIVGVEFPKTKTMVPVHAPRIIEVVVGKVFVLLHPQDAHLITEPPPVCIVELKEREKLVIPPRWAYTVINSGNTVAFFVELVSSSKPDVIFFHQLRGAPFYLILRNSNLEIVKNPNYKNIEKYGTLDLERYTKSLYISPKTPIIKQFLRKYERFSWFYNPDSFAWDSFREFIRI